MPTAISPASEPITSDYLGTRIVMLDAIARYHSADRAALDDSQKLMLMRQLLAQAATENQLLGNHGSIVGLAWARFLDSSQPAANLAFLYHPHVIATAKALAQVKAPIAAINAEEALGFFSRDLGNGTKNLNEQMEKTLQECGVINYQAGETLASKFGQCLQEVGGPPAPVPERLKLGSRIRHAFASMFGSVNPADVGMPAVQITAPGSEKATFKLAPLARAFRKL